MLNYSSRYDTWNSFLPSLPKDFAQNIKWTTLTTSNLVRHGQNRRKQQGLWEDRWTGHPSGGRPLNLIESLSRSSSREILCTKDLHLCLRKTATRGAGERKQRRRLLSTTTHCVHPSIRKFYPKYFTIDVCFCVVLRH
jgi:hypothetical protein